MASSGIAASTPRAAPFARTHGRTSAASWLPGTTTTSRSRPSRAPSARRTGSATSIACRGRPSGQLDDVAEQHEALDAVEGVEQGIERLIVAQDVAAQAGAEVQIGDDERGHAGATMAHTAGASRLVEAMGLQSQTAAETRRTSAPAAWMPGDRGRLRRRFGESAVVALGAVSPA